MIFIKAQFSYNDNYLNLYFCQKLVNTCIYNKKYIIHNKIKLLNIIKFQIVLDIKKLEMMCVYDGIGLIYLRGTQVFEINKN